MLVSCPESFHFPSGKAKRWGSAADVMASILSCAVWRALLGDLVIDGDRLDDWHFWLFSHSLSSGAGVEYRLPVNRPLNYQQHTFLGKLLLILAYLEWLQFVSSLASWALGADIQGTAARPDMAQRCSSALSSGSSSNPRQRTGHIKDAALWSSAAVFQELLRSAGLMCASVSPSRLQFWRKDIQQLYEMAPP